MTAPANPPRRWPRRGEIWWAYILGQPNDPHQPRPVLIISIDARNRLSDDVIVVPCFTRGRLGPTRVAVPRGMGGLPNDCILYCDEVTTVIHDHLASGPLGAPLPDDLVRRVVAGIFDAIAP